MKKDRIFDAFYSTKPSKGHGLGLATVQKIIEMYGGSISFESKEGEFTHFILRMKRSGGESQILEVNE
jgi:signal transduction histidine kinase